MPNKTAALKEALTAVHQSRALLEEEQNLIPVDVESYEEDEDGEVQSIRVETNEDIEGSIAALQAARSLTYPLGLEMPEIQMPDFGRMVRKLVPAPRKYLKYQGKEIRVLPWANLDKPWSDRTSVVLVNVEDMSWYGPYEGTGLATRSARNIAKRGDNQRRRVPMPNLKMVREKDWPPAKATFTVGDLHRMAARKTK